MRGRSFPGDLPPHHPKRRVALSSPVASPKGDGARFFRSLRSLGGQFALRSRSICSTIARASASVKG